MTDLQTPYMGISRMKSKNFNRIGLLILTGPWPLCYLRDWTLLAKER